MLNQMHLLDEGLCIKFIIESGIVGFIAWLLILMIYRRNNWARWLYWCVAAFALSSYASHFNDFRQLMHDPVTGIDKIVFGLPPILYLAAAFLLFLPKSNEWFKARETLV